MRRKFVIGGVPLFLQNSCVGRRFSRALRRDSELSYRLNFEFP